MNTFLIYSICCLILTVTAGYESPFALSTWIVPPQSDPQSRSGSLLRISFNVTSAKPVARLKVYISGLGQFELRLNGRKVSDAELLPGWTNYNATCLYSTFTLGRTDLLAGENVLGVLLGNGMYNVPNVPGRYTKFVGSYGPRTMICSMVFTYVDGSEETLSSGARNAPWLGLTLSGPLTTSLTYGGEDFDARLWPQGWDEPGFDASGSTGWLRARSQSAGSGPTCVLRPSTMEPLLVMERLHAVRSFSGPGNTTVYDLGKNFAGWPTLEVYGSEGAVVQLLCGELLNRSTHRPIQDGSPNYFTYTLAGSAASSPESWVPRFSFYGFRWILATISGDATVVSVGGHFVYTSAAVAGSYASSTPLFNSIHRIVLESMRSNFYSIWFDCPHREKLGWLEVPNYLAPSIFYNIDARQLYPKIIRDMAEAQNPSGLIPDIAPEYTVFAGGFLDSPEWGSTFLFASAYAHLWYNDSSSIEQYYDNMVKYVHYLMAKANPPYILKYGLGDWCDANSKYTECDPPGQLTTLGVTGTAVLHGDLQLLARFATHLGRSSEAAQFLKIAGHVAAAFHTTFFNESLLSYGSQTADAMALELDVAPAQVRGDVLKALLRDIAARGCHQTGGDIGHVFILRALRSANRSDILYNLTIQTSYPSYGSILAAGATSLTEQWDGGGSQIHSMLGHIEEIFYSVHLGIRVEAGRLLIKPCPHASREHSGIVESASGRYDSPVYGLIEVAWNLSRAGSLRVQVTLPAAMVPANRVMLSIIHDQKAEVIYQCTHTAGLHQLGNYQHAVNGTSVQDYLLMSSEPLFGPSSHEYRVELQFSTHCDACWL